jgi:AraC-like DNA-binding protein
MQPRSAADALVNLEQARAFMDAQLDQPLDLAQIAARANYSPYHFIRAFRKAFYETPHQSLIHDRSAVQGRLRQLVLVDGTSKGIKKM